MPFSSSIVWSEDYSPLCDRDNANLLSPTTDGDRTLIAFAGPRR
jgi:hypothetical protein